MPAVADYAILLDNQVALGVGGDVDHDVTFFLPGSAALDGRAVLTLQMEAEDPDNLRWDFRINGTQVAGFTHNTDRFCAIQEVVEADVLRSGGNSPNEARIRVEGGQGTLKVSDVVLYFQNAV